MPKEICGGCHKNLLQHHKLAVCHSCSSIVHSKCANKLFNFDQIQNKWTCWSCASSITRRYNPFSKIFYDKHLHDDTEANSEITLISSLLTTCRSFSSHEIKQNINKDTLSLMFNNIDGFASNFDSFNAEVVSATDLSVYTFAETNINEEHINLYPIEGYQPTAQSKIANKAKGSGLAIYVRNNLLLNTCPHLNNCSKNLESLFVSITNTPEPITIGVVYRPPSGNEAHFLNELENLAANLPPKNVYITGDFNIDLLKNSTLRDKLEDRIFGLGLLPLISVATHFKPGCNPSCLDNILCKSIENVTLSGTLANTISHHVPIFCCTDISYKVVNSNSKPGPRYDYCESNLVTFRDALCQKLEALLTNLEPSSSGFSQFSHIMKTAIDECFLTEPTTCNSKRNRQINPWVTNGIINSIAKKESLYARWTKSCNRHNKHGDQTFYLAYKEFRRRLKNIITSAKQLVHLNKFQAAEGDCKKTWQLINELRGKSKSQIKPSFIINGTLVEDRRTIANAFNTFFTSIASKMNAKLDNFEDGIPINAIPKFTEYMPSSTPSSMYMSHCTTEEVSEIISQLNNSKASDISARILKKCSDIISPILSQFYNSFMDKAIFPEILKVGQISPIFKKGDAQLLDNYRPVSLLPIFGKIFEKIIYSRLYDYLCHKNIIYDKQFGFRKSHSTSHAINFSVNTVAKAIEDKKHVIGIFIDLSKAFDTINHSILLTKLDNYGIRGRCLDLIRDYLSSRKQVTKFLDSLSDTDCVQYGVPQGSVLGPLLFLLYINDIINSSTNGHFVLFADDTNIFVVANSENEAYATANQVLNDVYKYMVSNQLHINLGKCTYMHFKPFLNKVDRLTSARTNTYQHHITNTIKVMGNRIKKVDKVRFLGVIIDDKLNWEPHIAYLGSKLLSCIVMIKRIRKCIPKAHHNSIYHSLFVSHLTYGISAWGGACPSKFDKIFTLQKRCVRLLFGNNLTYDHSEYYETCARARPYDEQMKPKCYALEHTKPIFYKHKLLTFHNLYTLHTLTETFKILKFRCPISIYELIKINPNSLRNTLLPPRVKLDLSLNNYVSKAPSLWNQFLPKIFVPAILDPDRNIVIPGSSRNSDISSSSIGFIKNTLKRLLLSIQSSGDTHQWLNDNFSNRS